MSKTLPIAVQVYSVREEAERDFAGTMKKLGEMGYDGVELAGLYGKSAEEIRDSIKAAGLTAISAHVSYDELAGDLEKTLQDYETIGCRYIVIPWLGEDRRFGAALYEETIKGIPVISEGCKKHGMTLLYHNHDFEFAKTPDGTYALDQLYAEVPADVLGAEPDTCWIKVGGPDPSEWLKKYSGRCPLVHVKDFRRKADGVDLLALGEGEQDFPTLVKTAKECGAQWLVIEQDDHPYGTPMGDMKKSLNYLKELGKESDMTKIIKAGVVGCGGIANGKHFPAIKRNGKIELVAFCDLIKERAEELEIIHSDPESYFKERKAAGTSYPVVEKSLNPVAEGCYTSQVRVKQKHRLLENEILVGEKMATQAELLYGTKYPKEEIHEAVRALLFSEFHDALPGSGTQQVEEDTLRLLDHGLELMSRVNCRSAIALTAGEAPIKEGSSCAFLYNPHPYPITGQFAFEVGLPKQNWDPCFYHPRASVNGEEVPTQSEMECSHFCIDWRKRVVVEATLKPCAMNRVDVWFDAIEKRPTFERISRKENFVFDNGKMRIEINPRTGLVDSWKVGDTEYLKPGSFCPVAIDGTYNSWGLWKNEPGARRAFTLLTDHEGSEFSGLYEQIEPSVRVIEDGKVRTVVEALFGWHNSKLYQRYILPKNDTHMDVEIGVYWNENDTVLKWMIPSAMEQGTYYGQVMFGREALAQEGQEVVAQRWNAWTDGEKTFTAVNGGSYGSSIEDGVIGLTLLHSAGYSAADFDEKKTLHEVRHTVRMEQGERKFAFRFEAGKTDLLDNVDRTAQAYNEEPYVLAFNASGAGEKKSPAILVDQANVLVSAWKKAENGEGYTLRLYESTGKDTAAVVALQFAGVTCPVSLKGFEIKTLHYDEQTKQLTEADLLD